MRSIAEINIASHDVQIFTGDGNREFSREEMAGNVMQLHSVSISKSISAISNRFVTSGRRRNVLIHERGGIRYKVIFFAAPGDQKYQQEKDFAHR